MTFKKEKKEKGSFSLDEIIISCKEICKSLHIFDSYFLIHQSLNSAIVAKMC